MLHLKNSILVAGLLVLAACAKSEWADDEFVSRSVYRDSAPTSITLLTMINNRSGDGGHSALMINASQRVIYDPAGTWWHRTVPERNDLLYGITPQMYDFYIDYHARTTYHVVVQTVEVTPEVAELALRLSAKQGASPNAMCSTNVSEILARIPGFETSQSRLFPHKTMKDFNDIPGVKTHRIYQNDDDDNSAVLEGQG